MLFYYVNVCKKNCNTKDYEDSLKLPVFKIIINWYYKPDFVGCVTVFFVQFL